MRRLIARRTHLVFETPLHIGKRPLIVAVEAWALRLSGEGAAPRPRYHVGASLEPSGAHCRRREADRTCSYTDK
jgi:hypothetical protein